MPTPIQAPEPGHYYVQEADSRPEAMRTNISHLTGAQAATEYSWRAPSPPHIYVPQPRDEEELALPPIRALGYTAEESAILNSMTSNDSWISRAKDWKYSWRREAQSILPFLQLGPSSATRNLEALKNDGVTMLLVIRNTASAQASLLSGDKAAKALGISAAAVDVASNGELIAAFPRGIRIINDHLVSQYRAHAASKDSVVPQPCGNVLVFCESGNERSAAFVVAYLMTVYGMELVPALQYVQSQRFCVAFDDGLKHMLSSYQDILVAQRCFAETPAPEQQRYQQQQEQEQQTKPKRRRDEIEDEDGDVDMGQGDDEARFEGRTKFVPFQ